MGMAETEAKVLLRFIKNVKKEFILEKNDNLGLDKAKFWV